MIKCKLIWINWTIIYNIVRRKVVYWCKLSKKWSN